MASFQIMGMPGINGLEFLRHVRCHYRDLPFILFTGKGREEIAIEALNSGADFYLQKGGEQKPQFVELEHKLLTAIDRTGCGTISRNPVSSCLILSIFSRMRHLRSTARIK